MDKWSVSFWRNFWTGVSYLRFTVAEQWINYWQNFKNQSLSSSISRKRNLSGIVKFEISYHSKKFISVQYMSTKSDRLHPPTSMDGCSPCKNLCNYRTGLSALLSIDIFIDVSFIRRLCWLFSLLSCMSITFRQHNYKIIQLDYCTIKGLVWGSGPG